MKIMQTIKVYMVCVCATMLTGTCMAWIASQAAVGHSKFDSCSALHTL